MLYTYNGGGGHAPKGGVIVGDIIAGVEKEYKGGQFLPQTTPPLNPKQKKRVKTIIQDCLKNLHYKNSRTVKLTRIEQTSRFSLVFFFSTDDEDFPTQSVPKKWDYATQPKLILMDLTGSRIETIALTEEEMEEQDQERVTGYWSY